LAIKGRRAVPKSVPPQPASASRAAPAAASKAPRKQRAVKAARKHLPGGVPLGWAKPRLALPAAPAPPLGRPFAVRAFGRVFRFPPPPRGGAAAAAKRGEPAGAPAAAAPGARGGCPGCGGAAGIVRDIIAGARACGDCGARWWPEPQLAWGAGAGSRDCWDCHNDAAFVPEVGGYLCRACGMFQSDSDDDGGGGGDVEEL
ncbi:hypothetical protein TeGR_g12626, partial [Tetraparma gracilis]